MYHIPTKDNSSQINFEIVGEALLSLDMNRRRSTTGIPDSPHFSDSPAATDLLQWSTSHRGRSMTSVTHPLAFDCAPVVNPSCAFLRPSNTENSRYSENKDSASLGRLPRIIRKVASMRADIMPKAQDISHTGFGKGQRPIPKVRSFRSILRSSENRKEIKFGYMNEGHFRHGAADFALHSPAVKWARTEKSDRTRQQHFSTPLSSTRVRPEALERAESELGGKSGPRTLGPAFLHRPTRKESFERQNLDKDMSFMNISPDRHARSELTTGVKRETMKSLLSRAIGKMQWRKRTSQGNRPSCE